jgi:hypothetical protein
MLGHFFSVNLLSPANNRYLDTGVKKQLRLIKKSGWIAVLVCCEGILRFVCYVGLMVGELKVRVGECEVEFQV